MRIDELPLVRNGDPLPKFYNAEVINAIVKALKAFSNLRVQYTYNPMPSAHISDSYVTIYIPFPDKAMDSNGKDPSNKDETKDGARQNQNLIDNYDPEKLENILDAFGTQAGQDFLKEILKNPEGVNRLINLMRGNIKVENSYLDCENPNQDGTFPLHIEINLDSPIT
jgi:hypothetical protein